MKFQTLQAIILAPLVVAPSQSVHAISYCNEPNEPYCIDAYGTFNSDWSFKSCRREVEAYSADMDRYVNCMIDEANQAVADANRAKSSAATKVNDLIEKFNCKARGDSFCY